jgi:hypothetical protein
LENEKGLSNDQIKKLHRLLTNLAISLTGREMIFELCQEVQNYLYLNNKPPAKSFYDQRLENQMNFEREDIENELFDDNKKCDENVVNIFNNIILLFKDIIFLFS